MSPVADPYRAAGRYKSLEQEQAAAAQAARLEYIKPIVMLVVGIAGVVIATLVGGGGEGVSAATLAAFYPVVLVIELLFGIVGLWVASKLFLGGAGTLGLAILRLAAIYAFVDFVAFMTAPLLLLGWFVQGGVYLGLLCWLFELDFGEAFMLAVITWGLKIVATVIIAMTLMS